MIDRVIFSTSSRSRKPEYQIQTTCSSRDGRLLFSKQAISKRSVSHINQIYHAYAKLQPFEDETLHFARITNHSVGVVEFEFVEGENLESMLLRAILVNDTLSQDLIINTFTAVLEKLVVNKNAKHKHDYDSEVLGGNLYNKFRGSRCIYPGLFDCNLDNIITDGSMLHFIDYEWCFDYCIPYDLVVSRAFMWFFIRHRETLILYSESLDMVTISENIIIPRNLYIKLHKYIDKFQLVVAIEWKHFQKHVNGMDCQALPRIHRAKKVNKKLFALEELQHLRKTNKIINNENKELKLRVSMVGDELEEIKRSKSYRALIKINSIRHFLHL